MLMVTRFIRVMTYHKELITMNSHDPSGYVRSYDKLITLYIHLRKFHGYETRQGADDLQWEALIINGNFKFDSLKTLYFHYRKIYDQ